MVVNQMGIFMPNIQHWFTIHSSILPGWQDVRADAVRGLNSDYVTHSKQGGVQTDVNWTIRPHHGTTSGMAAIMVALCLGYERVVLAGIPADDTGHFYPADSMSETEFCETYGQYKGNWLELEHTAFDGRVRSLSGNTKKWFGTP